MKKHWLLIFILVLIKLTIHLAGNGNYGFHRDELLHLSAGDHLAWGYMEFPPFVALVSWIAHLLFDTQLAGIRLFPTLAGVGILILCCRMAEEMGGKKRAVLLSGICILGFIPFFRNHLLLQPVAFDQLFWTLGFYYVFDISIHNHPTIYYCLAP
jgi:4-amino-4-deoxy-L-arabinose transferase-like glycosyltransferase